MKLLTVLGLAAMCQPVVGHAWMQCTKWTGSKCEGYQRDAKPRDDVHSTYRLVWPINSDTDQQKRLIPSQNCCSQNGQRNGPRYSSQYPQASARAGETLTLTYEPNGHVTIDPTGVVGPNRGAPDWYIFMAPQGVMKDMRSLGLTADGPSLDVNAKASGVQLIAQGNYDDGRCGESPRGDNVLNNRQGANCQAKYTIPAGTSGNMHLVWLWKFRTRGEKFRSLSYKTGQTQTHATEWYTGCFDVQVSGSGGGGGGTSPVRSPTNRAVSPTNRPGGGGGSQDANCDKSWPGYDQVAGSGFDGTGFPTISARTDRECEAACERTAGCKTYVNQPSTNNCWLSRGYAQKFMRKSDRTYGFNCLARNVDGEGEGEMEVIPQAVEATNGAGAAGPTALALGMAAVGALVL